MSMIHLNTFTVKRNLTKLGIANNKFLLLHFLFRDLARQELLEILGYLALDNTSHCRQSIGSVLKFGKGLELDTR